VFEKNSIICQVFGVPVSTISKAQKCNVH